MSEYICARCFVDCGDKDSLIQHIASKHLKNKVAPTAQEDK